MSDIVISITGDEKKALDALRNLAREQANLENGLGKVGEKAGQVKQKYDELGRAGQAVFEATRSPIERYERELDKLRRLLDQGKISQETYNRAVEQAGKRLDEAGRAQENAFGPKALGMINSLAAAFGLGAGLAGAIQLARQEYEHMIEAQKRAAGTTLTEAGAQRAALLNLGAKTPQERDRFLADIDAMAGRTGVSKADLYQRAASALSAKGPLKYEQAMGAVEASAQILPGDTSGGTMAAGAMLDLMKQQGGSAAGNLGQLLAFQRMARATDLGATAQALPPVLLAGTAGGMPVAQTGALWAAITNAIGDPKGMVSAQATMKLFGELDRLLPEKDTFKKVEDSAARRRLGEQVGPERRRLEERLQRAVLSDEEYRAGVLGIEQSEAALHRRGRRPRPEDDLERQRLAAERSELNERVKSRLLQSTGIGAQLTNLREMEAAVPQKDEVQTEGTGAKTLKERFELLHKSKEAQDRFLAEGGGTELEEMLVRDMKYGRERARIAVRQLIRGEGQAWETYRKYAAEVPTVAQAEKQFPKEMELMGGTPEAQTAKLARILETGAERLQTENQPGARMAIAREKMAKILADAGLPAMATRIGGLGLEAGGEAGALPGLIGEFEERRKQLAAPIASRGRVMALAGGAPMAIPAEQERRAPTDLEQRQAAILGEVVVTLKQILEETKRGNDQPKKPENPTLVAPNKDK